VELSDGMIRPGPPTNITTNGSLIICGDDIIGISPSLSTYYTLVVLNRLTGDLVFAQNTSLRVLPGDKLFFGSVSSKFLGLMVTPVNGTTTLVLFFADDLEIYDRFFDIPRFVALPLAVDHVPSTGDNSSQCMVTTENKCQRKA